MGNRHDKLGIKDTSGLTDADWADINKLKRAYDSGGDKELTKAFDRLSKDPVRTVRVLGAFFPHKIREALRDKLAEMGMTAEDLRDILEKWQPTKQ